MANNELLKKIELLTEYEAAIEEMKAEAEEIRNDIKAEMEARELIIMKIKRIKTILTERDMLAKDSEAESIFYASDLSENFTNMITKVMEVEESSLVLKFKNLDL